MTTTPNLGMVRLVENQEHAEVSVNEALQLLDALCQPHVLNMSTTTPPGSPADGDKYIIPSGASGVWASRAGQIAVWFSGWRYVTPKEGWHMWVENLNYAVWFDGTYWWKTSRMPAWSTANRPASVPTIGHFGFDTTLGIPIFSDGGGGWKNAAGSSV